MHMEKQAILEYILHVLCVFKQKHLINLDMFLGSKIVHLTVVQLKGAITVVQPPVKYTCAKVPQTQVNVFYGKSLGMRLDVRPVYIAWE